MGNRETAQAAARSACKREAVKRTSMTRSAICACEKEMQEAHARHKSEQNVRDVSDARVHTRPDASKRGAMCLGSMASFKS
jgi:hypothetical protein